MNISCPVPGPTGNDEAANAYKQFSKDFFDLIVIDECHRGSAAADSAWREILTYFNNATHIGLTATPKKPMKFPILNTSVTLSIYLFLKTRY